MKKTLLTSVIAFVIAVTGVFAGNADLFSYDKDQLNSEFANLDMLENYVKINEGITLTSLMNENHPLVAGISLVNPFNPALPFSEPPLGVPSFWWGCIFGVVGIAIVYFVTEDKDETMASFKGCVVGTLISIVLYFAFYVWILGNAGLW